jgi:hypothetical protein
VVWCATFATVLATLLAVPLVQYSWEGFAAPYRYQLGRVLNMPMTIYHAFLPEALGGGTPLARGFRLACTAATVGLLCLPRVPDLASLLRRGAVVLIVFQCVQVFYSPQHLIWLLPLLLPLTGRHPLLGWLVALLDVLTFVTFPLGPPPFMSLDHIVRVRYLVCLLLVAALLFWDFAARSIVNGWSMARSSTHHGPLTTD